MKPALLALCFTLLSLLCNSTTTYAATYDFTVVGNPGNAADTNGLGAVADAFRISKTEVTNEQYAEFLNAVARTDTNGLYNARMSADSRGGIRRIGLSGNYIYRVKEDAIGQGPNNADYSYADKPVVFVSFYDAMRFANWLHNGRPNSGFQNAITTEAGVYNINSGRTERRAADAKYWIPSEDEWYKAAFHDASAGGAGVYFDYATGTDAVPNNNLPSADTGNSANFLNDDTPIDMLTTGDVFYPLTDVGSYTLSESPYGTYDQNGNVSEWNEGGVTVFPRRHYRGIRGGSWISGSDRLLSTFSSSTSNPTGDSGAVGFRVAAIIPEPSSMLLGVISCLVGFTLGRYR